MDKIKFSIKPAGVNTKVWKPSTYNTNNKGVPLGLTMTEAGLKTRETTEGSFYFYPVDDDLSDYSRSEVPFFSFGRSFVVDDDFSLVLKFQNLKSASAKLSIYGSNGILIADDVNDSTGVLSFVLPPGTYSGIYFSGSSSSPGDDSFVILLDVTAIYEVSHAFNISDDNTVSINPQIKDSQLVDGSFYSTVATPEASAVYASDVSAKKINFNSINTLVYIATKLNKSVLVELIRDDIFGDSYFGLSFGGNYKEQSGKLISASIVSSRGIWYFLNIQFTLLNRGVL